MIYFEFSLDNLWFVPKEDTQQTNLLFKDGQLSTHKFWEVQIAKWEADTLFKLEIDLRWWGRDHAGPSLDIEILGWMFCAKIYDNRHWDWDNNCWEVNTHEYLS